MTTFVLDNSVCMRWFFETGTHFFADRVLHNLTSAGHRAVVSILWQYEVASVLARAQNRGRIPEQEAADFIVDLTALPIEVDDESGPRILTDVHRLATVYRSTGYDAAYLELARRRDLPLATLDAELIAACDTAGVQLVR